MKKLLIMTTLIAGSSLLSGCGSIDTEPGIEAPTIQDNSDIIIANTGAIDTNIIEATGTIDAITGDSTTTQIKAMIEKRKIELANETGNKKELNEKDIQLLESVLAAMTKKK